MIFEKDNVPFFNELEKTNQVVCVNNEELNLYEASNWDVAQQVDALMGNETLGYDIDEYVVDKNKSI